MLNPEVVSQEILGPVVDTLAPDGSGIFVEAVMYKEVTRRLGVILIKDDGTEAPLQSEAIKVYYHY